MKNKIMIGLVSLTLGAFAVTSCDDVDDPIIVTSPILSEVTTGDATVTATTATLTGTVKGLTQTASEAYTAGVVYSTSENPVATGSRTAGTLAEDGTLVTELKGLSEGVTYYYATFVTLNGKVSQYGEVKSFITTDAAVATAAPAAVAATSANLGGTLNGVQDKLDAGSLEYGIAIAPKGKDLATAGIKLPAEGTANAFTVTASSLVPNAEYDYATYMNLNGAYVYGNVQTLKTEYGVRADQESADDYVDMGTRLQWCRYNVGAAAEGETGALLGYGDLTGYNHSTANSDYATGDISNTAADVAVASGMGIMPTAADWADLFAICDQTVENGCIKLTSRTTGNSILLPMGGTRMGADITAAGTMAAYWTATADPANADYAYIMNGDTRATAQRATGACVRPVRRPFVNTIVPDNTKLAIGDLESNGRVRIEIYNEFGSTKADAPIDINAISFEKQMVVRFNIAGINDNLKDGAKGSYRAGLEFADASWDPSYWSAFDLNANDCIVKGDGSYTVKFDTNALTEGAVVFCIDIDGLGADLVDISKVTAEITAIELDPKQEAFAAVEILPFLTVNKEDNGTDVRVEFYNEYGPTKTQLYPDGDPYAGVTWGKGTQTITLQVAGIDGNLKAGAAGSYKAGLSLACGGWWPSTWGGDASDNVITGDGTYRLQAFLEADGAGTVVFCIDIAGLWADLVDTSKLDIKVTGFQTPVTPK